MLSTLDSAVKYRTSLTSHDLTMKSNNSAAFCFEESSSSESESNFSTVISDTSDDLIGEQALHSTSLNSDEIKGLRRSHSSSSISSCLSDYSIRSSDSFFSAESAIDKEREELRRVFDAFDKNLDGKISHEELLHTMSQLGFNLSEKEIASIMASVDDNGDGFLDFEEFISVNLAVNNPHDGSAGGEEEGDLDLLEAFRVFDKNSDGYISVGELQLVLSNLGLYEDAKLRDYENMIRAVDMDGDGRVNFSEFKAMMSSSFFNI
ncbi:hypothetical protein O6H91_16G080700 [Diphasiastrum complanatum]|nr:hypothetical protein O6H91_16G080700 [Diphasiastrum complanatum]